MQVIKRGRVLIRFVARLALNTLLQAIKKFVAALVVSQEMRIRYNIFRLSGSSSRASSNADAGSGVDAVL